MSEDRLDHPALARRLAQACRAAGARRGWWRRWRAPGQPAVVAALVRCAFTGVCLGLGAAGAGDAAALQLLTLAGLLIVQTRSAAIAGALGSDPALAVLGRLPVADARILAHQLRPLRWARWWAALDAAAFWCGAWTIGGWAPCWWALPGLAVGHALASHAAALWLWRGWSRLGCLPLPVLLVLGIATTTRAAHPLLWNGAEPVMQALGWLTPWGWLVMIGTRLADGGAWAVGALTAVLAASIAGIHFALTHLRRTWRLDPGWRELAGRPAQTLALEDDEDDEARERAIPLPPAETEFDRHWRQVWDRPAEAAMAEQGWAGRRCTARLEPDARVLAGALAPTGPSDSTWRWCLGLAAAPMACLLAGMSPLWGVAALSLLPAWRRNWWGVVPGAGVLVVGWLFPDAGRILAIAGPASCALLGALPLFGGDWRGLPAATTPLGRLPRTWRLQHAAMLRFLRLRLAACLPIAVLAGGAAGLGFHPGFAAAVLAVWLVALLTAPWMCAYILAKRTVAGVVDLGLGRWWASGASLGLLVLHGISAIIVLFGSCRLCAAKGDAGLCLAVIAGAALVLTLGGELHVRLLRLAYRRTVDIG
ncbi:MAG: hypothetical protein L6R48_14310 [Planctomycetes bacterium]|nr:hypothetical protein [Planctomycetota bacterium]